jgi:hypothetical protein
VRRLRHDYQPPGSARCVIDRAVEQVYVIARYDLASVERTLSVAGTAIGVDDDEPELLVSRGYSLAYGARVSSNASSTSGSNFRNGNHIARKPEPFEVTEKPIREAAERLEIGKRGPIEAERFEKGQHIVQTPVFANEPIVEVEAPIAEAQLVETFVMNQIHLQTVLASKATRVVEAAQGRQVVDFGLRRMHGIDAGLKAARAFHIAGVDATSNVAAGQAYGLRVAGTLAHSYTQTHDDEYEAFRAFARLYPDTVLLVDTYDTLDGVREVIDLARELGSGFRVSAVRLDSGDLGDLAVKARRGLGVTVLEDAIAGVDPVGTRRAIAEFRERGAQVVTGSDLSSVRVESGRCRGHVESDDHCLSPHDDREHA